MRVLVTGGFGYIGSHTVVELHEAGHEVFIIDNCSNSSASVGSSLEKIIGKKIPNYSSIDLKDKQPLFSLLDPNGSWGGIDAIIHFAASKAVGESMEQPLKYYENNVGGTGNLLQAAKRADIPHFVFSSSCTVYGEPDECPVTENFPIKPPSSVYGHTKQICEDIINNAHREFAFNSLNLRYFNPVGSHSSGLIGDAPTGVPDNLMPYITQTAAGVRDKLTIFGNTYDTPDGTCIRDYIHVVDLAKAHVLAVEFLHGEKTLQNFGYRDNINLGTGTGYSVNEIVDTFERENNIKIKREYGPPRAGDITEVYADPSYALQILNWEAKLDLKDMVKSAWNFQNRV